jgi:hypothetical protein
MSRTIGSRVPFLIDSAWFYANGRACALGHRRGLGVREPPA